MTDRIRTEFELFAHQHSLNTASTGGRYNAPVVRYMWLAWQHQAERITDMALALNRVHVRNATLANHNRQLNETISRLSHEGQDAVEM